VTEPEILARVEGSLGHLTLNRPRALNALNAAMVTGIHQALQRWADDPDVLAVLIDGAGERGLCAGGDVKTLYFGLQAGSLEPYAFWSLEYAMNAAIACYPKPYVAFMDGICFGGGIGVSVHGSVRIVTERSQLAMPETALGLFPDVGARYWLARMPGGVGTYAALLGARLNAADAIIGGLADFCRPSTDLPRLVDELRAGRLPDASSGVEPPAPMIGPGEREWIDACFTADTVEEIADRLALRPEPAAADTLSAMRTMSPTSLKVTLAGVRRAALLDSVGQVLKQDVLIATACTRHPDLAEGIRAVVVDKDRNPRWQPARWEDVSDTEAAAYFTWTDTS